MDSVSQFALGAAVGIAVFGGRIRAPRSATAPADGSDRSERRDLLWKAALWGGVAGTLPDLDVFIDHGDAVSNMVRHRSTTHALFWLTLASLPLAAAVARLHGEWPHWRRWWLALGLALVTHPLLDTMTVYGTQLAQPFSSRPYGIGSVFIIDPLYTLPLLAGAGAALVLGARRARTARPARREGSSRPAEPDRLERQDLRRALRANAAGLVLSTAYLAWGFAVQQHVSTIAQRSLAAQGIAAERVLVTPTPFNSVLWRIVAVDGARFHEGFYSLLDAAPRVGFDTFDRGGALLAEAGGVAAVRTIAAFSHGFYKLQQRGDDVLVSDLRMGQEPTYTFTFAVAERRSALVPLREPRTAGARPDPQRALPWLWRRLLGTPLPPPR